VEVVKGPGKRKNSEGRGKEHYVMRREIYVTSLCKIIK